MAVLGTLQEMMEDMERGVYDFTKAGGCSNCGQCCSRFLPISAKEVKNIKRYIQKNHIKGQKHFYPTAQPMDDWTCPFRSEKERKCLGRLSFGVLFLSAMRLAIKGV